MDQQEQLGLILGGIFTAGTTALLIGQHIVGPRPKLRGRWDRPARVRVASGTPVELLMVVREAVSLWRDQGADILPLVDHGGDEQPVAGEIVFTLRGDDFDTDHTGETITSYFADWTVRKAQCRIRTIQLAVVAHELGHALGFTHVAKNGHVMNRRYTRLGLNFQGCRSALRDA